MLKENPHMRALISATVLALALTACGGGGDDSDSKAAPSNEPSSAPDETTTDAGIDVSESKCADVIKVGVTLPDDYESCVDDEGSLVPALMYTCDDGRSLWAVGDNLSAFKGEPIADDSDGSMFEECKP